ncbi:TPA: antirestriction protein [Legionella bozemanae]
MKKSIFANLVPQKQHERFLNKKIGIQSSVFEQQICQILKQFSSDYRGNILSCFQLSNNGFYMMPSTAEQTIKIFIRDNDYEGCLSTGAAGVVASLFAINAFSKKIPNNTKLIPCYYALEDFAYEHPEASAIFEAID